MAVAAGRAQSDQLPSDNWGYFKVPGCWPGITDYMQKDCQTLFSHASWRDEKLAGVNAAWYQREISVPKEWADRGIAVCAEYLNSYAAVYVDGRKAGEMRFPAGRVDVTALCRPGGQHVLSMYVVAMPLKGVMLSFADSAAVKEAQGSVARRGLCGDVWLVSSPAGARIADVEGGDIGAPLGDHVHSRPREPAQPGSIRPAGRGHRERSACRGIHK